MNAFHNGDGLLIVDVQKDFCPGGALAIEKGDRIIPNLNHWIENARQAGIPVYASRDWHPAGHISFKKQGGPWPAHCRQDSDGAEFHPDLHLPDNVVKITKGVHFDHDQNSVFDRTGLAERLKRDGVQRIFIGGLALDVCVLASALDARKAGFEVQLIGDAVRPVDEKEGREALSKIEESGSEVVATDMKDLETNACQKAPEWAEHARFEDADLPCDDGRSGKI